MSHDKISVPGELAGAAGAAGVPQHASVVVVGGGVAGLAAASTLVASGADVVLLEARARLGGRVHTVAGAAYPSVPLDLGASWYHDTLDNCLFDRARARGDRLVYTPAKGVMVPFNAGATPGIPGVMLEVLHEFFQYVDAAFFAAEPPPDVSLAEMMDRYLADRGDTLTHGEKQHLPAIARYLELWHGVLWRSLLARYAAIDNQGRDCYNVGGYGTLVQELATTIPPSAVHLNTEVVRISTSRGYSDPVVVHTAAGPVTCAHVIVTVPQSVIMDIEWLPPLPPRISTSLTSMGYGHLGKCILEFGVCFWGSATSWLLTGNGGERLPASVEQTVAELTAEGEPNLYPITVFNLVPIYGKPILMVLTQAPVTQWLEERPARVWPWLEPRLRAVAEEPIQAPLHIHTTSWSSDRFSKGSYSVPRPGDDPGEVVRQLETGWGKVRFAGEHTISEGAGCVHGAYMSGVREGEHVAGRL